MVRWLRSAVACSLGSSAMIAAVVFVGPVAPASQAVALRAVPAPEPVSAVQAATPGAAPTSDPSRIVVEVMGYQNLGTRNLSDPIERVGLEAFNDARSSADSGAAGSNDAAAQDREEITKDVLRVANVTMSDPGRLGRALLYPVKGQITSQFGLRFHPILRVWKLHSGTDFGVGCGTPVGAAAAGTVTFAGFNVAYGNRITIDHGTIAGQLVSTTYNHLSGLGVRVGQKVVAGQGIALSGNTGWSTDCHLHLEVLVNGQFTNPMPWLTGKPASPSDVVLTGDVGNHSDNNTAAQGIRPISGPVKTVGPNPVTMPTQTASSSRPPSVPASSSTPASTPAASSSTPASTPAATSPTPAPSTSTETIAQPSAKVTSPSPSRTSASTQPPAETTKTAETTETAETALPTPEPTETDATKPSVSDPAETP